MSTLIHPLKRLSGKDHDRRLKNSWGHCQHSSRTITHVCFADEIDSSAGEEQELAKVVERPDKASKAYSMEISAEKTKLMTNNTSCINSEIIDRNLRQAQASSTWAQL